ncbi:hypothetical protein R6Q57_013160 [Mikania cordata]
MAAWGYVLKVAWPLALCHVDNLAESSSKQSILSVPTSNVAPFSVTMNNRIQIDSITFEALSGSIKHLIEQNNQVLYQISANISLLKLQDNINLFNHMKNNITTILNDMRYMHGPPFPISLNEDLAHSILPTTNQVLKVLAKEFGQEYKQLISEKKRKMLTPSVDASVVNSNLIILVVMFTV